MCCEPTRLLRKAISSSDFSELRIAHLHALFELLFELLCLLARELDDPARWPVMLHPGLHSPVTGVVEPRILQVQLQAGEPLVDEIDQAFVGWIHARPAEISARNVNQTQARPLPGSDMNL